MAVGYRRMAVFGEARRQGREEAKRERVKRRRTKRPRGTTALDESASEPG
jgi:hypothetical protein